VRYVDFIDVYAGIREDEREAIFREITEQEDTIMLAQYIKDKGFQEGKLEGWRARFTGTIINPSFWPIAGLGAGSTGGCNPGSTESVG
jgi:hypothetical protein